MKKYCVNLEGFLKHDNFSDLNGIDLFLRLKVLKEILPKEKNNAIDLLNFHKDLNCFLDASIAYRILLIIHVTVASAKGFFNVKIIKILLAINYFTRKINVGVWNGKRNCEKDSD